MNASDPTTDSPRAAVLGRIDDYARDQPTTAVASAFGLGLLLHILPIGAIVGTLAALAFTLARPLFLFLGVVKAFELINPPTTKTPDL